MKKLVVRAIAIAAIGVCGAAFVQCVSDGSNTQVVYGDGGPNSPTLPDGAPNPNYDGGANGCTPCVVGAATIGNCCVQ